MAQKTLYMKKREAERRHRDIVECIDRSGYQRAEPAHQTALGNLRDQQFSDAERDLTGRKVSVYRGSELVGNIRCSEVLYSTATVCFALGERNERRLITKTIEVTPDMDVYIEDDDV